MGDPAGIGPEITLRAWLRRKQDGVPPFFAVSCSSLYAQTRQTLALDVPLKSIATPEEALAVYDACLPVLELPEEVRAVPGKPDTGNAAMIVRSIETGVECIRGEEAAAIVTNPINKAVLYQAGFGFPGHTEFLANLAQSWGGGPVRAVMMLAGPGLRTVPLTIHEPLRRVPDLVTRESLLQTVRVVAHDLAKHFGISAPRIAVCGLNPHAGECGSIGTEELEIIGPAIEALQTEGIRATGPHSADTLFHPAARKTYDVVVSMYHDQALIPLKMLAFDQGVNITLGLPFIRTSPDHGTAYDIAGKGLANPSSLIAALRVAAEMALAAHAATR